jgi:hypothetical protein
MYKDFYKTLNLPNLLVKSFVSGGLIFGDVAPVEKPMAAQAGKPVPPFDCNLV